MSVGLRKPFSIGLVVLCALVVLLTLGSVPALAAAPETPELKVEAVTENAATFNGVLSPKSLGELGSTYQFLYRVSKTECKGESKAPEPPGMSLGAEGEGVSEPVSGLTPNTGYTVCLHVENAAKTEEAVSLPVHFITALEAPETLAAEPVGVTTATLKGVLSPNATVTGEPAAYEFLYRQSATECEGGEPDEDQATHVTAASGSRQEAAVPVTGLLPGAQYSFCLLERNTANETVIGPAVTFTTHGAGITEEQTTSVEATAATLQADIDPNESSTSYHFEYDTTPYTSSTSHGTSLPVPSQAIGSGTSRVSVSVRVTGLQPGTRYYYRVVAVDEIETFYGPGKALTTPVAPGSESSGGCPNEQLRAEQPYGLELPDCRAYEMVSPVEKNGQDATEGEAIDVASGAFVSRAAVSGDAIEFQSSGSFADPLGSLIADEYISRRGPEGWSTESITPPLEEYESPRLTAGAYESMVFTPELSKGVATTDAPLSSEAPAGFWELYLANFATGSYQWLSNAPTNREPYTFEGLSVLGASTDLSHVVFASYIYDALAYEWVEGKGTPTPVNVTNNGGLAGDVGDVPEGGVGNLWHAVSSDGSRVFFSNGGLYVRENAGQEQSPLDGEGNCTVSTDACTVEVSASQKTNGADPNGPRPARYWGASANGAKVFFTSSEELTDDAYTGPADNAANLYEYDLESGRLTDLTVDTADIAEGAAVQGVVQISEEGSYVYFVAKGALAPGAVAGALNLYVSHEGGVPAFIATLAEGNADAEDWARFPSGAVGGPSVSTAVVSPDGTRLAFISHRNLTGYDNTISSGTSCGTNQYSGKAEPPACREVFEYDAVTKQLVCVSCDPSGARPTGPSNLNAVVGGLYRARSFSESGALFFQSFDALVPHASDGRQNVYEYENGHVYPISDVAGNQNSFFMDASASGNNVFIGTADQLLPQDRDNRIDVYDARVNGGFPVSVSVAPCDNGDSCKPPATPQPGVFGAPASATFSGAGNVTQLPPPVVKPKSRKKAVRCAVGRRLSHGRCVKSKRTRQAKKSANKGRK